MSNEQERTEPGDTTQVVNVVQPVNVNPPDKFCVTSPASWPAWRKRFERYMSVSGQLSKSEKEKINILVYIMGEEAEEIMVQFPSTPATYSEALKSFEDYFIPRRNIIFERFRFNSRTQMSGESIESFITSLHSLAEHCNYGTLKEELIRDRIVVGMLDSKTSERMQLKEKLDLKECILIAKQAEQQASQNKELYGKQSERQIGRVQTSGGSGTGLSNTTVGETGRRTPSSPTARCGFCGLYPHSRGQCPAYRSTCRKCQKKGHWASVCRRNQVRSVQLENPSDLEVKNNYDVSELEQNFQNNNFLGSITINHVDTREWVTSIFIEELRKSVKFLVDTGADISCIPKDMLSYKIYEQVKPSDKMITGPSGIKLKNLGTLTVTLHFRQKSFNTDLYVIDKLTKPILGRTAIIKLQVLGFICNQVAPIRLDDTIDAQIFSKFSGIFSSIGNFKTEMQIKLVEHARPYVQSVPRVVPIPLLKPLKEELERLKKLHIIEQVDLPTEWVSPIVVVQKNSKIRLCVDYTHLNKAVLRSHFPIGKVETILAQIKGSNYFSKLDTNSGFYQIKLCPESQLLTTFITPFGRFYFKRLPFGITCAPEYFSILLNKILSGLDGVISHIDDILIHAPTLEQHNKILLEVLKRIKQEGITLNKEKCVFASQSLVFLGHQISNRGILVDPERIRAIELFPEPKSKKEVLQYLGMLNFSSRFIPNRAHLLEPLTSLLKKNVNFIWGFPQEQAFEQSKKLLSNCPMLACFDPTKQISISADASSYGLGACLLQISNGKSEVVAYASRLLSETEKRYAQIEREALALAWAMDKFSEYVTGVTVLLQTDHRPLIQVLQSKPIDELTPRLQRFRIRLMRYDYKIYYSPGKELVIADALSRNFSSNSDKPTDSELTAETEAHVRLLVQSVEIKTYFLDEIRSEQSKDPLLSKIKQFTENGWPNKNQLDENLAAYFQYRFEISFSQGLLLRNTRIIIPSSLQLKCLKFIHDGHLGIVKCRRKAKTSVWWVGLSTQLENLIRNCPQCIENRSNFREPMIKDCFPDRPWQKIALDLFKNDNTWFLIVTDYYSRFFEIFKLLKMTESVIIEKLKELFSRYGISEIVRSDNGPQFRSEFKKFALEYDFRHITSSPYFAQSNGCVEAAVKIAKNLLKKNDDIHLALLSYRTTPLECGFSPCELMFGRKVRNLVPMLPSELNKIVDTHSLLERESRAKDKSANQFNARHRSRNLSTLSVGDYVWVTDLRVYAKVIEILEEPRSYLIESDTGVYRRNRWNLIPAPYYRKQQFTPAFAPSGLSNSPNYCNSNYKIGDAQEQTTNNECESVEVPRRVVKENLPENVSASVSDCPSGDPPQETVEDSLFTSARPQRVRKKPSYLGDYILN